MRLTLALLAIRTALFRLWPAQTGGRHRMTKAVAADPHRRDWAAIQAERLSRPVVAELVPDPPVYDALDPRTPLVEVERRLALFAAVTNPTRELAAVG